MDDEIQFWYRVASMSVVPSGGTENLGRPVCMLYCPGSRDPAKWQVGKHFADLWSRAAVRVKVGLSRPCARDCRSDIVRFVDQEGARRPQRFSPCRVGSMTVLLSRLSPSVSVPVLI